MTSVWFIGNGTRTISSANWASLGITADSITWAPENGWSVPTNVFNNDQLDYLDSDAEFLLGQTGPRLYRTPISGPDVQQSAAVYAERVQEMYDLLIDQGLDVPSYVADAAKKAKFLEFNETFNGGGDFNTSSSGHAYITTQTTPGAQLTKVDSGLGFKIGVSSDTTTVGPSAGYKQWDNGAGKAVTFGQADLQYTDTGNTDTASFCWASTQNPISFAQGAPVLDVPIHIVVASTYFSVGEFTNGTFTELFKVFFKHVGFTRFHVEYGVDYDNGIMWLRDPYNKITKLTHNRFKSKARYSFYELYFANSTTDDRPFIYSVGCSTVPLNELLSSESPLQTLVDDYANYEKFQVKPKTRLSLPGYVEFGDKAALPRYPAIALVGDSMVANSYTRHDWDGTDLSRWVSFQGDGFFNEAMVYAGQPATWWSFGVGGRVTSEAVAGFDTEVGPYQPQIVLIHCANNDIAANKSAATIFADMCALIQKIWDIGAKAILCNTFVRTAATTAQQKVTYALNSMIYQLVAANPSNLALLDVFSIYMDPTTGFPKTDLSNDGVHLNSKGAWLVGKQLESIFDRWIHNPGGNFGYAGAIDETNCVANSLLTGTTGVLTANNGLSGQLADGWYASTNITDANGAAVLSKVAHEDGGFWQQVNITKVPNIAGQVSVSMESTTGFVAGDVVQGYVKFETDEDGWQDGLFDFQVLCYNATPSYSMQAFSNKAPVGDSIIKVRPERGVLVTPPFTVPVGATKISPMMIMGNLGTVRWSRPAIRKLNKVAF